MAPELRGRVDLTAPRDVREGESIDRIYKSPAANSNPHQRLRGVHPSVGATGFMKTRGPSLHP
ncbi:protein of unknown function [uncultured Sphingopyxis sp.]|uniref:Uncharacterized protein n=1 Tax=uncultured Sphingopyxis sp. TaxID=310581 RepID=A0A1Y5PR29_9SPHN|nr:protein of unknown function [uncultured Sphingopyxis sp.]